MEKTASEQLSLVLQELDEIELTKYATEERLRNLRARRDELEKECGYSGPFGLFFEFQTKKADGSHHYSVRLTRDVELRLARVPDQSPNNTFEYCFHQRTRVWDLPMLLREMHVRLGEILATNPSNESKSGEL